MRQLVPVLFVLPLALAGCSSDGDCPDVGPPATVERVDELQLTVRLANGEPVIVHLDRALMWREQGGGCVPGQKTGVAVGQRIAFHVDEMADSYPPQAWPEDVVLLED